MSQIYFYLYLFDRICGLFFTLGWWLFAVSLLLFFATVIIYYVCYSETKLTDDKYEYYYSKPFHSWRLFFLIFVFIGFILGVTGYFAPSKTEIITYCTLKEVDKYNKDHKTSVFNPENVLGGADKQIQNIGILIDKSFDKINSLLNVNPKVQTTVEVKK
jgi:hypothetical protein